VRRNVPGMDVEDYASCFPDKDCLTGDDYWDAAVRQRCVNCVTSLACGWEIEYISQGLGRGMTEVVIGGGTAAVVGIAGGPVGVVIVAGVFAVDGAINSVCEHSTHHAIKDASQEAARRCYTSD